MTLHSNWDYEVWINVYDDGDSDGSGDSDGDSGDTKPLKGPGSAAFEEAYKKMFTPEQQTLIDQKVEDRLARAKKQNEATIKQLETLKSTAKLNEEERNKLQQQINQLETVTMTEKELAAKARKEENEKHARVVDDLTVERDTWRSRFESTTIKREIVDAASRKESRAFNPSQIVSLLAPSTTLVEETEDGKGTGVFVARVKFNGRDSENKPLVMDLTVPEAIDEMQKMPDLYGNLFESGLIDGLGKNNVPGSGALSDASYNSQEAYRKNREALLKGVK